LLQLVRVRVRSCWCVGRAAAGAARGTWRASFRFGDAVVKAMFQATPLSESVTKR
jgi:hypothetical protein